MLKEYRICMPMTVDEYQVGQLYMIARHSAEQSDSGEGVEVIENNPHCHPEHGKGQYTEKRIHLSSKLPSWMRSYMPKFIYVTEKGWNYYPYTETEYTCSIVPKFSIKIWTRYENNNGSSDNCLDLTEEQRLQRSLDHIDILTEPIEESGYKKEEDPRYFVSSKTGRGPLVENWEDNSEPIMCSYKLVDISFKVFGFQTKVEEFAQRAIRNVLLLGHRQAYTWIDDWHGMTIDDVRTYEMGMQEQTNKKIRNAQKTIHTNEKCQRSNSGGEDLGVHEDEDEESCPSESSTPSTINSQTPQTPEKSGYFSSWFKWT